MKPNIGYMSVFIVIVLVLSVFAAVPIISLDEVDTDIVLVRTCETSDMAYMEKLGVNIIEVYDSQVLVEVDRSAIVQMERTGFTINRIELRTTIYVNGYEFDFTEGEPSMPAELMVEEYPPGVKGQYIVHMVGPIARNWRQILESMGAEVLNYIPNYAYRVRMTPEVARKVEELDFVDWVGVYHPYYKLQPDIEPGIVTIGLLPGADIESFDGMNGANVITFADLGDRGCLLTAEVRSEEDLYQLARIRDVDYIQQYVEPELHGEVTTQHIGGGSYFFDDEYEDPEIAYRKYGPAGSYMNQIGYTGRGFVITIADSGICNHHPDFQDRVIGGYSYTADGNWHDDHGHGTACAGVAAADTYNGTGSATYYNDYFNGQGSAPEAFLFAVRIFDGTGSYVGPSDAYEIIQVAAENSDTIVHSNSWGAAVGGSYDQRSSWYDEGVRDFDMVVTTSAGNSGPGYNTIGSPATGKNVITVGSTLRWPSNPEEISSFSSRGWTDDNRIKPDVVAPGSSICTTAPCDGYGQYQTMSGTSMANPAVAGTAAVTIQWYNDTYEEIPSPAMVKALLINTAIPLDGNTEGPIPNRDEGWGLVDISKLERPLEDPVPFFVSDQEHVFTESGQINGHMVTVDREGEPLKFSLVWTDKEAGNVGGGRTLINDLNLEVEAPNGDIYRGNAFASDAGDQSTSNFCYPNTDTMSVFDDSGDGWDDTNNIQNVYIHPDEMELGTYTVRIEAREIADDGVGIGEPSQNYALVTYNGAGDPQIEIERPEGGEYWSVGTEEEIIWSTSEGAGQITHVDLEYSADGGTTWTDIETGLDDTGSYMWLIPDDPSFEAVVRGTVYDDVGKDGSYITDEFTITDVIPVDVELISPNGGEEWHVESLEDIEWDTIQGDNPIDYIDLEYSADGGGSWNPIAAGIGDTGSYTWEIPDVTTSEALVRVWAYCTGGTSAWDTSDDYFELVGYPPKPPTNLEVEWWSLEQNIFFEDDVEDGDLGYTTGTSESPASEWDIRQHGAAVGDNSWDFGDGQFYKTSDYGYLSWLISPEITIPADAEYVEFTFQHWRDWGDTALYDAGNVKISTEGADGPWTLIVPEEGYDGTVPTSWDNPLGGQEAWGGSSDWTDATFDLSDYRGENIHVRWDAGVEAWDGLEGAGWRVDDIIILEETPTGTDHNLLTWDASPDDPDEVVYYNIYRSEEQTGPWDETTFINSVEAEGDASYSYVDLDKGSADDIWWWYVVRAVGPNGLEEQNTDAVQEPGADLVNFDIELSFNEDSGGWNFVSFNVIPSDSSLETILEHPDHGISGNYDRLMYFDASADSWYTYVPGREERFNNLENWNHRMGVWIRMTTDDVLTIEGTEPDETTISLQPGWNMVGYPSDVNSVASDVLPDEVIKIGLFNRYAPYNIEYIDDLSTVLLVQGRAYWVYNDADYEVDWIVTY